MGTTATFLPARRLQLAGLERGLDLDVLQREVPHGLVALEDGELGHEPAELVGAGLLVTQDVELVLHKRVIDDREALGVKRDVLGVHAYS